ncbi:MAG TPA: glycosyltransferase [Conexibacter sp.]|jgi:glycosyltransferase involved in cell wall biosynthesis|nr:glycosyltransferase [Conexibacter sp.]
MLSDASSGSSGVVVYRRTGDADGIDAIDEYSRRLVGALGVNGSAPRYVADGLSSLLASTGAPSWILLQYNPFRYGPRGFAPDLVRDARRLRHRSHARLAVMVHEAWVDMTDWRTTLMGLWQRAQLRALLRLADGVMTSTQALARELGRGAVHVPIAATIMPVPTSPAAARDRLGLGDKLAVALFGRANPSRALDHAEAAVAALTEARGADRLAILNLGADAPPFHVPPGVEVRTPGRLGADELSLHLWASDMVLLPLTDGVSTRRTTLMAALAHGRPVIGLRGRNTDAVLAQAQGALALTPAGDPAAFARAAVELTADGERLRALGDAGRRLYESHFDWPVVARRVASVLETTASIRRAPRARARDVIFVAHDVGGSGGMERQSEQLVGRLLEAGRPVTVIARTCALAERDGLRFRRVPAPRRPATLAYPAFFVLGSLLLARRREALLHTTGAIVANRADVSTVHYCHRAAAAQVEGSRASRPDPLYRVNAALAGILARAGEAWCYRPARTGLLCAVSGGVGAELRNEFPAMQDVVRTVANGVDATAFRPDARARREVRAQLGIDARTPLALFVGGDWERKGLSHAVDALELAPGWQLAVAGGGDPAPPAARARSAGTESRLRFLGVVRDMSRLYAAADAFVLPTAYEAFPLVALEAAASGLPLLVTRVNGVEDLLQDGCNGWFVARDGRDVARRLNELGADPLLARRMGAAGRTAAAGYSWEAMTAGYLAVYAELDAAPSRC